MLEAYKDVDDWAGKNPVLFENAKQKYVESSDGKKYMEDTLKRLRGEGRDLKILDEERKKAYQQYRSQVIDEYEKARKKALDDLTKSNYFDDVDSVVPATEAKMKKETSILVEDGEKDLLTVEQTVKTDAQESESGLI